MCFKQIYVRISSKKPVDNLLIFQSKSFRPFFERRFRTILKTTLNRQFVYPLNYHKFTFLKLYCKIYFITFSGWISMDLPWPSRATYTRTSANITVKLLPEASTQIDRLSCGSWFAQITKESSHKRWDSNSRNRPSFSHWNRSRRPSRIFPKGNHRSTTNSYLNCSGILSGSPDRTSYISGN